MNKAEAVAALGLTDAEASVVRSIRAAWARLARSAHPDTAEPSDGAIMSAASKLAQLNQARDLLLELAAGHGSTCKQCRGTGRIGIKGRFGSVDCPSCAGTGDKFNG